jgi:uncharacterized membrane protein
MAGLRAAAGLGAVSGLRTMQGLAWVSRDLLSRRLSRRAGRLERWLADPWVAGGLRWAAAGELVVDKMPWTPDRIRTSALLGRAAAGAVVGFIAAGRERAGAGAAVGAASAVAGAFGGWSLRRALVRGAGVPDAMVAVAEDAVAVGVARALTSRR